MARVGGFKLIEILAARSMRWASGSYVLFAVVAFFLIWSVLGPLTGFSLRWQSYMTVPSAAITLLMVFLLVRAQNKDTMAIQMKLNEIIAALNGANNQLIGIENISERAMTEMHKRYETVVDHVSSHEAFSTEALLPHEMLEEVTRIDNDKDSSRPQDKNTSAAEDLSYSILK